MGNAILITGDERLIIEGLKFSLELEGYAVDTVYDRTQVSEKVSLNCYELIILDLNDLEEGNLDLYQSIREKCSTPIIALIGETEIMDKTLRLKYSSWDFMTKPINIEELKSRARAAINRAGGNSISSNGVIKLWNFTIDTRYRRVYIGNREIKFTSKEYDILILFVMNKNKVYSREALIKEIWGENYNGARRIVDMHIRRLREKIESDPSNPQYIITKWGVGYFFNG